MTFASKPPGRSCRGRRFGLSGPAASRVPGETLDPRALYARLGEYGRAARDTERLSERPRSGARPRGARRAQERPRFAAEPRGALEEHQGGPEAPVRRGG